jgi:DNA-binding IscR family transcriptional regulator
MRVASRFAVGVHVLSLLGLDPEAENSSDHMAGSIGANPVIVRNVIGMLRRAGLVTTRQGVAGSRLGKPLEQITLLDVYRAVEAVDEGCLFAIHPNPNPRCTVGAGIGGTLERVFGEAQQAMETHLSRTTIAQVVEDLRAGAPVGAC